MRRTRRQWLINAGLVVVLAAVAGVGLFLASGRSASGSEASTVRTVAVRTGDVTASVSADGSVEAVNEVAANFETSGTIARLLVEVGDTVTKGEVVATLEKADARRAVKVARLQLSAAQDQLDSAEEGTTTVDQQTGKSTTSVSSSQVASAEAQVVQAQATLDDAEAALDATTLRAPISGTVLQVNGKVGSSSGSSSSSSSTGGGQSTTSSSSSDLVLIANLKALQVSVSVPESDIGSLTVGQKASVTFPAVDGAEATGTISSIDPVATTSNSVVTYGVVVRLSGVPSSVRLGQSASVTVTTDSATGVLVVPSTAVTTSGDRSTVTVLEDGQQSRTTVTLGVVGDTWTEVASGLAAGEQVVLTTSTSTSTSTQNGFPGGGFPGGGLTGGGAPPAGIGGGRS
ncbi:MAG: efflux RND transporter periplasmic adaptor subunit [Candidatus Nanopelagicales bacterium]